MVDGLDKFLRRYPDSPVVEDVLGTLDPREIRAQLQELEPETAEIFYFAASVGALFGGMLRDGACVYLRAYAARCGHAVGGDARRSGLESFAEALL